MKTLKNYLAVLTLSFSFLALSLPTSAQNVGINSKGNKPSSDAVLDLRTGNLGSALGFLPNEVSLSATNSASPFLTPDTGLVVYNYTTSGTAPNNVVPGYYYWTGSAWIMMLAPTVGTSGQVLTSNGGGAPSWTTLSTSSGWSLTGNSGTTAGTNFIGTTDNSDLVFKIGSQSSGLIDNIKSNTFFGFTAGVNALSKNGTGNTGVGYQALNAIKSGNNNVAMGYQSLTADTSGSGNTAVGIKSLAANGTGNQNTGIGQQALHFNTSGSNNTALGYQSLNANSAGSSNTAIGYQSLASNAASGNTALGDSAGRNNSNGKYNTYIGYNSGHSNTSLSNQIYLGDSAGTYAPTAIKFAGALEPYYSSNYNAGSVGQILESQGSGAAPQWVSSSAGLQAIGYIGTSYLGLNSGRGGTGTSEGTSSNLYNVNVGYNAGNHNQTGRRNIAIGNNALSANDKVSYEIAIGDSTLNSLISGTSLNGDIAIGYAALASESYNFSNIAIGYGAMMQSADGAGDVAIGFNALQTASASNDYVCALGYQSMMNAQDADYSNAFGYQSLLNDNGGQNSAFGYQAGQTVGSGANNTLIGYRADVASGSLTNAIAIGANAVADSDNTITLGNNSVVSTEMNGALKPYYSGAYHAGTTGQVLTSQGPDIAPQWKNASGGSGAVNYVGTSYLGITSGAGSTGTSEGTGSNLYNVNVGYNAGNLNQTGTQNIAIGNNTLSANDKVSYEIAIGDSTLNNLRYSGTSLNGDIAIGCAALASQSYNFNNIAIGYGAMRQSADGGEDVAIGFNALQSASASNDYVCAVGYQTMMNAQNADYSNAFGYQSLLNDNGGQNSAFGYQAGQTVGSGANNTLIGYRADVASGSLTNAAAIGANAVADSSNTVTLGNNSVVSTEMNGALKPYYSGAYHAGTTGQVLTSQGPDMAPQWKYASGGSGAVNYLGTSYLGVTSGAGGTGTSEGTSSNLYNINIGDSSGYGMTSGVRNIFLGDQAGYANTNLNDNIAIGTNTLQSNILANKEIAIGTGALQYVGTTYIGSSGVLADVAIGYQAMGDVNCESQASDVAIGYQTLYLGGYVENVAIGNHAQFSNLSGSYNSAFGNKALSSNAAGSNLSAFGYMALHNDNSAGDNSAFGYEAGDSVTSGTENTFLGSKANVTTGGLSNATAIGYNAIVTTSNTVLLGNSSVSSTEFNGALMPYYSSAFQSGNSGQVLESQGSGVAPQWVTPSFGTVTGSGTSTQIAFWSASSALSSNSNLYWDNTNDRLGIGTSSPTAALHTVASGAKTANYSGNLLTNTATSSTASITKAALELQSTGSWNGSSGRNIGLYVSSTTGGSYNFDAIFNGGGSVGIGIAYPTAILHTVASGAKTANYSGNLLTNTATSSTASIKKAGLEIQSTGTWNGSTASNIGLYVSSTTGGTNNYDAIFNGGGNVGIGTTAPTAVLHTVASGGKTANYSGNILTNTATSSTASITKSGLEVQSTGSWTGSSANNIGIYVSSVTGGTNNYDAIFNGGGNVGIGTTSPVSPLSVIGNMNGQNFIATISNIKNSSLNNDGLLIMAGQNNYINNSILVDFERPDGVQMGDVVQSSSTGVAYQTTSDERLKENIKPTSFGLKDLLKIEVRDYTYIGDNEKTQQTGYLAQQLYTVFPNAVHVGGDDAKKDPWMVDYGRMTPLLVKSIQDQQKIIEDQQKQIDELKQIVEQMQKDKK
ncbi:MAG TPA: tail fiber domain-containing protein [Bacteroidia bacterium]|nr:tail fiber domain-containing protein [Bacteroidia bacterium]